MSASIVLATIAVPLTAAADKNPELEAEFEATGAALSRDFKMALRDALETSIEIPSLPEQQPSSTMTAKVALEEIQDAS